MDKETTSYVFRTGHVEYSTPRKGECVALGHVSMRVERTHLPTGSVSTEVVGVRRVSDIETLIAHWNELGRSTWGYALLGPAN